MVSLFPKIRSPSEAWIRDFRPCRTKTVGCPPWSVRLWMTYSSADCSTFSFPASWTHSLMRSTTFPPHAAGFTPSSGEASAPLLSNGHAPSFFRTWPENRGVFVTLMATCVFPLRFSAKLSPSSRYRFPPPAAMIAIAVKRTGGIDRVSFPVSIVSRSRLPRASARRGADSFSIVNADGSEAPRHRSGPAKLKSC